MALGSTTPPLLTYSINNEALSISVHGNALGLCGTAYGKGSPGDRQGLCDTVRGSAAECHDTHHPPVGSPGQLGLHCKPRPTTTTRMVREDRGAAVEFTQHRSTHWVTRRTVAPSETDPDLPDSACKRKCREQGVAVVLAEAGVQM